MPKSAHAKGNGSDPTVIATSTESLEREDSGSSPDRAGDAAPRTHPPTVGKRIPPDRPKVTAINPR